MQWFVKKKVLTPLTATFLCVAMLAVSICVCYTLPQSAFFAHRKQDPHVLYQNSVVDAMYAEQNEIMPLFPLDKASDMTTFNNTAERVLLVSWHNLPESYPQGQNISLSFGEVWAFTDKEIVNWYAQNSKKMVKNPNLRLKQLLGLAPDCDYTHFSAMWVRPEDVFRPAHITDVGSVDMTLSVDSQSVSPSYKQWFDKTVLNSYFDSSYPWTRLGYTYDWAADTNEYGLSQFVIEKDSDVVVEFTKTTQEFILWLENYNDYVMQYSNVKELQKNISVITTGSLQQTDVAVNPDIYDVYIGFDTAFKRFSNKVKLNRFYADSDAQMIEAADLALSNNADVIFSYNNLSDMAGEIMAQKALENPKTSFVVFENQTITPTDNLSTANFAVWEGAFLAGFAAAKASKSGMIGFIGGQNNTQNNYYEYGFKKGASFVNNNCVVLSAYTESQNDAQLANEIANQLYISGADIIFEATGQAVNGIFEAAEKYKKYVMCSDFDKAYLAPKRVIMSVIKNHNALCELIVNDIIEKDSCGGNEYLLNLANGGVDISQSNDNINRRLYDEVLLMKEKIIAGEINVSK